MITYVSSGNAFSSATSNPSFSFSCPGANHMLIVGIQVSSGTGTGVTALTYNGVSMTRVGSQINPQGNLFSSLWFLHNPATGTNTLQATGEAQLGNSTIAYSFFTGMNATGQPDSNGSNVITSTSVTASTTVVGAGCWLVGACWQGTVSSMTNATNRSSSVGNTTTIFDSNGIVAAGSRSVTANFGGNDNQGMVLASFTPVASTQNSAFLSFM